MKELNIYMKNFSEENKEIVNNIFNFIDNKLQKEKHKFKIEFFKEFKNVFNEGDLSKSEKAICKLPNHILFKDSFFFDSTTQINQQSVFLHEIGHLKEPNSLNLPDDRLLKVYKESLADKFVYKIDEEIFKEGRVKEYIKKVGLKEDKGLFVTLGILYFYRLLLKDDMDELNIKIEEIVNKIKRNFKKDTDEILKDLEKLCSKLLNKENGNKIIEECNKLSNEINMIRN